MFEGWTPKEGDRVRNRSTKTPGILRKSPRGNWYADRPGVPEGERFFMRSLEEVWHFLEPDPDAESFPTQGTTRDRYRWACNRVRQACDEALAELDTIPDEQLPGRLQGMAETLDLVRRLLQRILTFSAVETAVLGETSELDKHVARMLDTLTPKERAILQKRFAR